MTTGGGNMEAYNLDITTYGISSAAIRTDRGGKNVTVDGGNYNTKGRDHLVYILQLIYL